MKRAILVIILCMITFNGQCLASDIFYEGSIGDKINSLKLNDEEVDESCFPYFSQYGERWADHPYGVSGSGNPATIQSSGCGPTSIAIAVRGFYMADESINPIEFADKSLAAGMRTSSEMFFMLAKEYGLECEEIELNGDVIQKHVKLNKPVIINVQGGKFSSQGHYLVVVACKGDELLAYNVASRDTTGYFDKSIFSPSGEAQLTGAWVISDNGEGAPCSISGKFQSSSTSKGTSQLVFGVIKSGGMLGIYGIRPMSSNIFGHGVESLVLLIVYIVNLIIILSAPLLGIFIVIIWALVFFAKVGLMYTSEILSKLTRGRIDPFEEGVTWKIAGYSLASIAIIAMNISGSTQVIIVKVAEFIVNLI